MPRPSGTRSSPRSTRSTASCGASRSNVSSTGCRPISSTPLPRRADPTRTISAIDLQKEADLATELGFDAEFIAVRAVPQQAGRAVRQPGEVSPAQISDRSAAAALRRKGLPDLRADRMSTTSKGTPITATTSSGARIHCEHVLIATHVPLQGKSGLLPATMLQSKLAPYSTYVVGGWVPRGTVHEGALLGYRRSLRLPARRSPARPRLRHLRRRRSQDRSGGRDDAVLQPPRAAAEVACCRRLP